MNISGAFLALGLLTLVFTIAVGAGTMMQDKKTGTLKILAIITAVSFFIGVLFA